VEQAKPVLITGRRNFLVRALGFTAAGATLSVPVVAMETPLERINHHMQGLEKAFADFYGNAPEKAVFNCDLGVAVVIGRRPPPGGHVFAGYYQPLQFPGGLNVL
jgi:hypothetical protein